MKRNMFGVSHVRTVEIAVTVCCSAALAAERLMLTCVCREPLLALCAQ